MASITPFVVLKKWKWGPKGRYASKIGLALTDITRDMGLVPLINDEIQRNPKAAWFDYDLHAEVRMTAVKGSEGVGWHQDGDTSTSDMDFSLVLWASRDHTQFKFPDSVQVYQPKPFELVIAKNLDAYHRRPPQVEGRRWQFRQRVVTPPWLE